MTSSRSYLWLLVFQMILAGLFFFLVRYDADKEVHLRGYEDIHTMIYIGFGFLMTFLQKYCYGAVGINWLLAALVAQWSIITQGVFHMHNYTIYLNKRTIIDADIMTATVLITFGALLGRASVNQMLVIAIIEPLIGSLNMFFLEEIIEVADCGGSMVIHAYGAFFGIGVSGTWTDRTRRQLAVDSHGSAHLLDSATYSTDVTAMIGGYGMNLSVGSLFLFVFWPSFNAALASSDADYQRAVVNTYISLVSCTVVTFVLSSYYGNGKFYMEHIQNSTLAGGVGVGTVCNMHINPGGAVLIGMGAAVISVIGYEKIKPLLLQKAGVGDTCGVLHLHGFPGVYSGILSIFIASAASEETYGKTGLGSVFEAMSHGRKPSTQGLYQLMGLVNTVIIALVFGIISGLLTRLPVFGPLKPSKQFDDEQFWVLPNHLLP